MRANSWIPCLAWLALSGTALAQEPSPAGPCRASDHFAPANLGYTDPEGYAREGVLIACKAFPDAPDTAAIAVLHMTRPFTPQDTVDGDYDLHLMVVDAEGEVLAEMRQVGAAASDAVRLDDLQIDTARYVLAPGVRAFGVRFTNAAHCYQCQYWQSQLGLFVREGNQLKSVLGGFVDIEGATSGDDEKPGCSPASDQSKTTVAIGTTRHAGRADLLFTTTTWTEPGFDQDGNACGSESAKTSSTKTWVYDGKAYRAAK